MTKMKLDKIKILSETLNEEKRNLSQLKKWFTNLRMSNSVRVTRDRAFKRIKVLTDFLETGAETIIIAE